MAKGPRYRVPYRRRRQYKTDYAARRLLATSGRPRLVARLSRRNILVQLVSSDVEGDRVLTQASSRELSERFGWLGGAKNTPAAYLLGLVAGFKALRAGVEGAILDIGLRPPTRGARLFAVAKGALDAGLKVPCDEGVMPGPERIEGAHIAEHAGKLREAPETYERQFADYLERGLGPEALVEHFRAVRERVREEFKG